MRLVLDSSESVRLWRFSGLGHISTLWPSTVVAGAWQKAERWRRSRRRDSSWGKPGLNFGPGFQLGTCATLGVAGALAKPESLIARTRWPLDPLPVNALRLEGQRIHVYCAQQ